MSNFYNAITFHLILGERVEHVMKPIHAKMYENYFRKENPGLPGNITDVNIVIHKLTLIVTNSYLKSHGR